MHPNKADECEGERLRAQKRNANPGGVQIMHNIQHPKWASIDLVICYLPLKSFSCLCCTAANPSRTVSCMDAKSCFLCPKINKTLMGSKHIQQTSIIPICSILCHKILVWVEFPFPKFNAHKMNIDAMAVHWSCSGRSGNLEFGI